MMLLQNNTSKPYVALFLDIDGVLAPNKFTIMTLSDMNQKVMELTGERFHTYYCRGCDTCSQAQSHLFKKEIVDSLNQLIHKITDVANVHIIISSTWRRNRTVEVLKKIFSMHAFSEHIIDKTIDKVPAFNEWKDFCVYPHSELTIENCMEQSENSCTLPSNKEFEDFIYKNWECRASQINRWLKEHPEYSGFIILDDLDEHLSDNFGDKFISTDHKDCQILKHEDCEKAYISIMNQLRINI